MDKHRREIGKLSKPEEVIKHLPNILLDYFPEMAGPLYILIHMINLAKKTTSLMKKELMKSYNFLRA